MRFPPIEAALEHQLNAGTEFEGILASWRLENVRAAMRFLTDASNQVQRSPGMLTESASTAPRR